MGIKIEMEKAIVETRRLGKYRTGETGPIQVEFGKNIFIKEDYFKETEERYNKLIINGEEFYLEQLEAKGTKLELENGKEETPKEKTEGRTCSKRSSDEELQERLYKITGTNGNTGAISKNSRRN
ncbi:hypothetical protein FQA39_LY02151 [Lamprigera yunnana]|nr:hypothetical protein FQA39_LY02151 [Lamprigera yunnana]